MSLSNEKTYLTYDPVKWTKRFEKGVENHEEKHKLIYDELVNVLGPRYVSDDPGISEAYGREMQTPTILTKGRAEFTVLPGSTKDVQNIVRLANRYKFPFSVSSAGMFGTCFAAEGIPYWCQIDLKRMDKLEIDEKNMYAIVEPYVTHAQLQVEAMKRGLFNGMPSSGGQSTVIGNHVAYGMQNSAYRTGFANKNILGVEWVLPNGDILRTGSLATPEAGYFYGEGPGPDARALIKGIFGHAASLGIITKMAVKLYPWPGPRVWPVEGVAPYTTVNLPPERFKWFYIVYPSIKEAIEAMREISKVEIGAILIRREVWNYANFTNKSREEHWRLWTEGYWEKALGKGTHSRYPSVVIAGLWGWASEKQLQYEEMLLKEIVEETDGKWAPDEVYQRLVTNTGIDCIRTQACLRVFRLGFGAALGSQQLVGFADILPTLQSVQEVQEKYTPPLLDTDRPCWVAPYELGHLALLEVFGVADERSEKTELELLTGQQEMIERTILNGSVNCQLAMMPQNIVGPSLANIHLITAKLKKALDPNSVANPTRFIDMEAMEEAGI